MERYRHQHALLDEALDEEAVRRDAVRDLRRYFGSGTYTGARFERLGGGGDSPAVRDRITAEDIVAVATLSVVIPARASLWLLEDGSEQIQEYLRTIPAVPIYKVSDFKAILGSGSPADLLWLHLNEHSGIGWVTAGKLLARKRPHLVPVYDRVVRAALNAPRGFWRCLWEYFDADGSRVDRWTSMRDEVGGINDISLIRCIDVSLWMRGAAEP